MPYIGKSPVGGGFHKLDNLTASATATYALTLSSAAYYPETANQLLVSLNGVIQAPQDSFTVSGSNLIFDSALTASDSIDFVVALGDVLGVGSVTDGAVTTNKIANQAVTMDKLATSGTLPALNGSALTNLPVASGSILQVKQTSINTAVSSSLSSESTFVDIAGMSVSITPSSASSKILVSYILNLGHNTDQQNNSIKLLRDSTAISGTGGGTADVTSFARCSTTEIVERSMQYLDSPATTSAVNYKLQWASGTGTFYLNRRGNDGLFIGISTITVMEIAG
jgi:hypothetical protein